MRHPLPVPGDAHDHHANKREEDDDGTETEKGNPRTIPVDSERVVWLPVLRDAFRLHQCRRSEQSFVLT